MNKSQQQTLRGSLLVLNQPGNDEQVKETSLQIEFEKNDMDTKVEETKQINNEKFEETLVDEKNTEETTEVPNSMSEVDKNDDNEDDDVAEARKQIKCHLERMRQTEEFLKSVNSEQQINSERQRLSQLKLCFDTLMSTSLVNKQQSMSTTSRLFGANNETGDSIYSSCAPIDCNINRSKGLLDHVTNDLNFNLNNQQLQRQQVNFTTNFNRDSSYQSSPNRRRFMSVERDFGIEQNYSISTINQNSFDQSSMNNSLLSSNQYQKSFDFDTMRSSRCSEIQNEVSTWRASRLRSRSQMNERFSAASSSYGSRHLSSSTADDLDYQPAVNSRSRFRSGSQNRHDYSSFNTTTPTRSYKTSLSVASQGSSSKQTVNDIKNDNSDNEFDAEMESYRPPAYEPTIVTNRKRFPSNQTIANDKTDELKIVDDTKRTNNNNDNTSAHANSKLSQLEARILERRQRTADLLSSSSQSSSQYQKRNLSVDRMTTKIAPVNTVKEYESKASDKQFIHGNTSNNDDEDDNNNIESMQSRIRRKSYCVKLSKDSSNNNLSTTTRKISLEKWREKRRSSLTISNSSSISIAPNNTITTNNNIDKQLN